MKLFRYVRSKRVISIVLSLMLTVVTVVVKRPVHGQEIMECKTTINRQYTSNKTIGIKTRTRRLTNVSQQQIKGRPMKVGATAYTNDPITSTGTKPTEGRTIAVDPRVIPYGTKVYIPQFNKVFIAEDCGSAIKGNRIDIYMNNYDDAMEWGFREITIYILED